MALAPDGRRLSKHVRKLYNQSHTDCMCSSWHKALQILFLLLEIKDPIPADMQRQQGPVRSLAQLQDVCVRVCTSSLERIHEDLRSSILEDDVTLVRRQSGPVMPHDGALWRCQVGSVGQRDLVLVRIVHAPAVKASLQAIARQCLLPAVSACQQHACQLHSCSRKPALTSVKVPGRLRGQTLQVQPRVTAQWAADQTQQQSRHSSTPNTALGKEATLTTSRADSRLPQALA